MAGWMAGWLLDGWRAGWLGGWMDEWMDDWLAGWLDGLLNGWMAGLVVAWMVGGLAGWLAGWWVMGIWGRNWVCEVLFDALQGYRCVPGPESGLLGPKTATNRRFHLFAPTGDPPLIQFSGVWCLVCSV